MLTERKYLEIHSDCFHFCWFVFRFNHDADILPKARMLTTMLSASLKKYCSYAELNAEKSAGA